MTKAHKICTSAKMPAGEYIVGDPCYSVPDSRWMEWLEAADYESEPQILLAELDGMPVLGISTAYGDGEYMDEQGRSYPVDAGLIGLVPVALIEGEIPSYVHFVTFATDFICEYDEGKIILGNIIIDTDPEYDPYEDENHEEDDYEDETEDDDDVS